MLFIILIVLVVMFAGGGLWGHGQWGPVSWSPLGVILVIFAALFFMGYLR